QRNVLDLLLAHVEHNLAEGRRAGVVQVNNGAFGPGGRLDRTLDQVFARLGQGNNGYIIGNAFFVDQFAHEIEVGLRSRGKTDFDLFEADLDELFKKAQLALDAHGLDQ